MNGSDGSTSSAERSRGAGEVGAGDAPSDVPPGAPTGVPAAGRAVAAALLAAAAAFLAVLGYSVWLGIRYAAIGVPSLRVVVEPDVPATVQFLSGVLEGPSGVWLLGGASLALPAWGLGLFGPGSVAAAAGRRLRRLWGDLLGLSRDAARWLTGLPRRRGRRHVAALAAVVLVGAALRLIYLPQPVRYDEAFTFTHFASEPLAVGLATYTYPNNHLLHTLLVNLATSVFGTGPGVMRLPALLAGVVAVPAAYAAWDVLGDADEALVAAAVAAASTPLVLYATNARGYGIVVLCSLLLVPLAARLLRQRDLAAWALFCCVSAAAFHAIPVALYPVGATLLWLVAAGRSGPGAGAGRGGRDARPRGELVREAAVALAVVGVLVGWLYAPAVQASGLPSIAANRWVTPSPVGEFAAGLPGFFAEVWSTWTAGWPASGAVVLGALALAGLARDLGLLGSYRRGDSGRIPGAASYPVVALAWSTLLLLASRRVPFARVWLFLVPVFGFLVARGAGWALARLRAWRESGGDGDGAGAGSAAGAPGRAWPGIAGPAAAVLLLAGLGGSVVAADAVVESDATDPYRDGEEVARLLLERMEEDDGMLALGPAEVVLEYWFQHLGASPDRVNIRPEPGGRLYLVVHGAEGQTLPEMMARLGVAGSRRLRTRTVAELEHSTLYELLPPEEPR